MRSLYETWTMMPMIFALTTCCSRMRALVSMLATLSVLTIAPAVAHADGIPDVLIHTFGTGTSGTNSCNNVDGAAPKGSLTFANNFLFGRTSTTTAQGNGDGIIFHIDPAATTPDTTYTIDHQFTGFSTDGNNPRHNAMTLIKPKQSSTPDLAPPSTASATLSTRPVNMAVTSPTTNSINQIKSTKPTPP